jgi:hypothetical protein
MKGVCPKCGASYYDWGLYDPICKECGSNLEITGDDLADRIYDIAVISAEPKKTRDLEITIRR